MSYHTWKMQTVNLAKTDQMRKEIIDRLEERYPEAARVLRAVDWNAVNGYVLAESLKDAANACGAELLTEYSVTQSSRHQTSKTDEIPKGKLVGVLAKGGARMGVVVMSDGSAVMFHHELQYDGRSQMEAGDRGNVTALRAAFEAAYRINAHKAYADIVGEQTSVTSSKDGTVTITAKIRN